MSETPDFRPPSNRGEPDGARPRFYMEPYEDKAESEKAGHRVFKQREMVHILIPGDRLTEMHNIVRPEHKDRWPAQYEAFKKGLEEPTDGTPLSTWPAITRAEVEELRYSHIRTIEELAALSDGQLNKSISIGGFSLREKAQRWLADRAGQAPAEKLAAENAELKSNMALMRQQMDDLTKRMEERLASGQASNGEPQ